MATITKADLAISRDTGKHLATPVVSCRMTFTAAELALMKLLTGQRVYKLSCELWGADSWPLGGDDKRFRYPTVYFFGDATPTANESRTFTVTLGQGVLDEDIGSDEIYAKLILANVLFPGPAVVRKTNEVSASF